MIANKIILKGLLRRAPNVVQTVSYANGNFFDERFPVGKREWVGYGINGSPHYVDCTEFPFPAVRYKEITQEMLSLREKEKGDWKNLSIEDKKRLYRISFCQTLAEIDAPTGEWKSIWGMGLFLISIGLWLFFFQKKFICSELPETFSDEWRAQAMRRNIDLRKGHLKGIASKWDYEKDDWKK